MWITDVTLSSTELAQKMGICHGNISFVFSNRTGFMLDAVYRSFQKKKACGLKSLAVLIDPDNVEPSELKKLAQNAKQAAVDFIFIGGSLVLTDHLDTCISIIKQNCDIPVLLFPGHPTQISGQADALLYLSLISGRNAELLIGQHVISAPAIKRSGIEIISTGYMVIDGGAPTTVSYMSNALPIPCDKADIAYCTALAGEMLGLKLIYLDAGSGALHPVREEMIYQVSQNITVPLVVGGGIREPEIVYNCCKMGADIVVVGNAIEQDMNLMKYMTEAVHAASNIKRIKI